MIKVSFRNSRPGDDRPPESGRSAGALQQVQRRASGRRQTKNREIATGHPPLSGLRQDDGRLARGVSASHRAGAGRAIHRRPGPARGRQLLQLPPARGRRSFLFGTIGPEPLPSFGKLRGSSEAIQKYAYSKIYNSEAFSACSNMPRLGHNGVLTERADHAPRGALARPGVPPSTSGRCRVASFLQALAAAAAAGLPLASRPQDENFLRLAAFSGTYRCCTSPIATRSCCR